MVVVAELASINFHFKSSETPTIIIIILKNDSEAYTILKRQGVSEIRRWKAVLGAGDGRQC